MSGRQGFTLVEVIVTLAIISVSLGAVGVAVGALTAPEEAEVPRRIAIAREAAIESGNPVSVTFDSVTVTLFPDGSTTPASIPDATGAWIVDPWTSLTTRAGAHAH